jgi:hypothetical protein
MQSRQTAPGSRQDNGFELSASQSPHPALSGDRQPHQHELVISSNENKIALLRSGLVKPSGSDAIVFKISSPVVSY